MKKKYSFIIILAVILAMVIMSVSYNQLKPKKCYSDNDCVPSNCCHSSSCTLASKAPACSNIMCTQECQEGTLDCGQGSCSCNKGECSAKTD